MIYKNSTSTRIELVHGDIREADERLVVIGRDPLLKKHFEARRAVRFVPICHGCGALLSSSRDPMTGRYPPFAFDTDRAVDRVGSNNRLIDFVQSWNTH